MDKENLKSMTPSELEHYGIKGMRWGVRRTPPPGGTITDKLKGRAKAKAQSSKTVAKKNKTGNLASVKREVSNAKKLKDLKGKTNEQLRGEADRVRNENNLRRLAKNSEYRKRANLSDGELKSRVERLQLEQNLKQEVKNSILPKERKKQVNSLISSAADMTMKSFTNTNGDFSPTGNPTADILLRESLKYAKSNNVVK